MSLHIPKLRLTQLDVLEPDTEKAILTIAENDLHVAAILKQSQNILGGHNELMGFLRVLDARHLTGYRIYQMLVNDFNGYTNDAFYDFIFYKMPCQICGEVMEYEPLMDSYEKLFASQMYFAGKFTANRHYDEEMTEMFDLTNKYDPEWQNAVHNMSHTSRVFHNSLPLQLGKIQIVQRGSEDEGLLNAKSRHGTIIKNNR